MHPYTSQHEYLLYVMAGIVPDDSAALPPVIPVFLTTTTLVHPCTSSPGDAQEPRIKITLNTVM